MRHFAGERFRWALPVGGVELTQIPRDALLDLRNAAFHLRPRAVQVFGRRDCWASHTLMRSASEKRQGTKSRWVGHPAVQQLLWGFGPAAVDRFRGVTG